MHAGVVFSCWGYSCSLRHPGGSGVGGSMHKPFGRSLPLTDLELIRFWGVSIYNCFHGNSISDFWVSYLVGVPETNPSRDLHQIFRTCLAPKNLELIQIVVVSSYNCCHGNTYFLGVLSLVGVPQTKPMQRFASNFQDMFTAKGSKADQVFRRIRQQQFRGSSRF